MRIERIRWDGADPVALAQRLRAAAAAPPADLAERVAAIIAAVSERGDDALRELTARLDATEAMPADLRVDPDEPAAALRGLDPDLRSALDLAAANIRAVAEAEISQPLRVRMPQGHEISLVDRPVAAAGVYAPGGRAAYPSSVLMCCVTARAAGVGRIALVSPPDAGGRLPAPVLAAAAIAGVDEVHAAGGAQAVAALALGTQTIAPVDVVAGPGNPWVTEAKRQLYGRVGIDGLAGPSELVVICDRTASPREIALDALAQAEHGADTPVTLISPDRVALDAIEASLRSLAPERPSVADASFTMVEAHDLSAGVRLSDALAPEHLELRFEGAGDADATERVAGCVFVGAGGSTAFGDYAAGSNHVLPTGGAARFAGPLGVRAFQRRVSVVSLPKRAAAKLAGAVDTIAKAEGLPVHGESARARAGIETDDLQVS